MNTQAIVDVTLTEEQLARITGRKQRAQQIAWLQRHRWVYLINDKGEPVVGRFYADRRLAGLRVDEEPEIDGPNLAAVR